jgi:hypothetical protein
MSDTKTTPAVEPVAPPKPASAPETETIKCRRCHGDLSYREPSDSSLPCRLCGGLGTRTVKWSYRASRNPPPKPPAWACLKGPAAGVIDGFIGRAMEAASRLISDRAMVLYALPQRVIAGVVRGKPVAVQVLSVVEFRAIATRNELAPMQRSGASCYVLVYGDVRSQWLIPWSVARSGVDLHGLDADEWRCCGVRFWEGL